MWALRSCMLLHCLIEPWPHPMIWPPMLPWSCRSTTNCSASPMGRWHAWPLVRPCRWWHWCMRHGWSCLLAKAGYSNCSNGVGYDYDHVRFEGYAYRARRTAGAQLIQNDIRYYIATTLLKCSDPCFYLHSHSGCHWRIAFGALFSALFWVITLLAIKIDEMASGTARERDFLVTSGRMSSPARQVRSWGPRHTWAPSRPGTSPWPCTPMSTVSAGCCLQSFHLHDNRGKPSLLLCRVNSKLALIQSCIVVLHVMASTSPWLPLLQSCNAAPVMQFSKVTWRLIWSQLCVIIFSTACTVGTVYHCLCPHQLDYVYCMVTVSTVLQCSEPIYLRKNRSMPIFLAMVL